MSAQIDKVEMSLEQRNRIDALLAKFDTDITADTHRPYAFAMKKVDNPDLPNFKQAMSGDNSQEYWEAMQDEIRNLEKRKTWDYVNKTTLPPKTYLVPGTWTFQAKRKPDGSFQKFQSRWCLRGDLMKKNGVEPDSVFSPVCQWSSVRLMLVLSLMLGLYTESVDFSNAFIQADLKDDVYVKPLAGFKTP